jgi:hypothetical protein
LHIQNIVLLYFKQDAILNITYSNKLELVESIINTSEIVKHKRNIEEKKNKNERVAMSNEKKKREERN